MSKILARGRRDLVHLFYKYWLSDCLSFLIVQKPFKSQSGSYFQRYNFPSLNPRGVMFAKLMSGLSFNKINIDSCFQWETDVAKKHCWLFMFMYCFAKLILQVSL